MWDVNDRFTAIGTTGLLTTGCVGDGDLDPAREMRVGCCMGRGGEGKRLPMTSPLY